MLDKAKNMLVRENLASLEYFQVRKNEKSFCEVSNFVENSLAKLPWLYKAPIQSFMTLIVLLNFANPFKTKGQLPNIIKKMPFYGMVNKLMRTLSFLALFDVCSKGVSSKDS